jgi:hypothetical protein
MLGVCLLHYSIIVTDTTLGVLSFKQHHIVRSVFQFAMATSLGLVNVWFVRAMRRNVRIRRILNSQKAQMPELSKAEQTVAMRQAIQNLKQVAKAMGAVLASDYLGATIQIGRFRFHTVERHICRTDRDGSRDATCLNYGNLATAPTPEHIAATLLLLKNNPTIFERWVKQDHFHA